MADFTLLRPNFQPLRSRLATLRPPLPLLLFLMALLFTARPGRAQDVSTYQLAATSGTFVPITAAMGATPYANLSQDVAISSVIQIFPFYYGGTLINSIRATSDGYLDLDEYNNTTSYPNNNFAANSHIAPLWDNLSGVGGTASSLITGAAPNRVFTFQWLDWRWNNAATVANISFQVKLYEGTNVIQFIYHPEAGPFFSASASATIGLDGGTYYAGDAVNSHNNYLSLDNTSANPTLASNLGSATSTNTLNTRPADGQTYTFTASNDYCGHATPLLYNSTVVGSTVVASQQDDPRATCSAGGTGTPSSAAGVFYTFVGNGQTVTVSTCSGPTASLGNTKLFVYTGTCGSFTCVGNNDDVLTGGCGTNSQASAVTLQTTTGTRYYVFVQFAQTAAVGSFGLSFTATGLATRAALGAGSIEVFPNPAQRAFTLRLPALAGERTAQLTLVNSLGQQVQARTMELTAAGTQTQVNVSNLAAGLYTLRVEAGSQTATRQVVVE